MSYTSNALTVGSRPHADASAPTGAVTGNAVRLPPDILTYCYDTRMVYVTPGEDYDKAINIAIESFPQLRDVERERICLEVRVVLSNQHEKKTAEIGRTAWSVVVATLARFEIVEVRVAPPPKSAATTTSGPSSSVSEPPPYASEMGWNSDAKASQANLVPYRPQMPSSLHQQSLTTRVVDLFTPKSSRGRHSPEARQHHRC
jgi:hypothetical protein